MSYIHFEKINKYFGDSHVLRDICLDIEKGELATFLGPSGCGKSTLLRCLSGLESVSDGQIILDGKDITNVEPKKRGVGMVFQQYSLFPNLTVRQNVAFGMKIQKKPKAEIKKRVAEMLEIVGLTDRAGHYPAQLSGGQQQRVALARAIVTEPKVLLLDEPLSAIDAMLRRSLQIEIRRIQRETNITTLFVTHDQDEAMVMSDNIHLFNVGVIEQSGLPVDLYTKPKTKFAATFIGHYNILPAVTFNATCGTQFQSTDIAIRPELIYISAKPVDKEGVLCWKGTVINSLAHGNILRYSTACGDMEMDVDILFDATRLFNTGAPVYLSVEEDQILELD